MPQINDTTGNQKTSFVLRVDAKAENFERVPIQRGTVDIIEGGIMVRNSSNKAAKVLYDGVTTINEPLIYLNFSNPNAGDVADRAVVNDVGGTQFSVSLESGGYVGVGGSGLRCGLPATERFFVKADLANLVPGSKLFLKREGDGAAERYNEVKFGAVLKTAAIGAASATQGGLCFAIVESVDSNLVWFTFGNQGYTA